MKITTAKSEVRIEADFAKDGREEVLGAAYLLTDRAYAAFEPVGKKVRLTLRLKAGGGGEALEALAEDFKAEVATQKVRWAIARANVPVREFIVQQAIQRAQGGAPAEASPEQLSAEQKDEIDRLIAEVEDEIAEKGKGREERDPKGISSTWEEKRGR